MKDDVVIRVNMNLDHGDVVAAVTNGGGDRLVRRRLHHFDNLRLLKRRHPAADHRLALGSNLNQVRGKVVMLMFMKMDLFSVYKKWPIRALFKTASSAALQTSMRRRVRNPVC
jgi:hypothetical protein